VREINRGGHAMQDHADSQVSTRSGQSWIMPAIQVAVLVALLVVGLLFFADDWRRLLSLGTLFPVAIIGVVGRVGLPAYRSRLPRTIQILLAIALISGSIPVGFLGERFQLAGLIWVFVIPTLLPDALPTPLLEKLRNAGDAKQAATEPDGDS